MTFSGQKVSVFPLRHCKSMLVQPEKNTKHWLGKIIWSKIDPQIAMQQLVKQTHQELEFFGVIRLDDHVNFIQQLSRHFSLNADKIVMEYLNKLESTKLDFSAIKVAQLISLNHTVLAFYSKHDLLPLTQILSNSNPEYFHQICELVTSKKIFTNLFETINRFGTEIIDKIDYPTGQIIRIYESLNVAVNFITLLQSDTKKFARMLSDDCTTCLKQIEVIAQSFEDKFNDEKLQFDSKPVRHLLDHFQQNKKENDIADAEQIMRDIMDRPDAAHQTKNSVEPDALNFNESPKVFK